MEKFLTKQKLTHFPNNGHLFLFDYFVNAGLLKARVSNEEWAENIRDSECHWPRSK